jgi:3-methyladenine DNA glycosylase AlkD
MLEEVKKEIKEKSDKKKAKILQKFFKTGKGEYGEGDIFLGISVPFLRKVAKKHKKMPIKDTVKLLRSEIHEERLTALLILIEKFNEGEEGEIFKIYLKNIKWINNWDLVDVSSYKIIGKHLFNKERKVLYSLARSNNIWERRIAIISTFYFIKNDDFFDTLKIAKILLEDKHDLIQKAVGWMLREVGKKDIKREEEFLERHYKKMSRTTLRYAIERFSPKKRKYYLNKK